MACWPTTTHIQITKLMKAGMGPTPGIIGMRPPFPNLYAPCYLLLKLKSKQQYTWATMKPDHHDTLKGAAAWPGDVIYCWYLLIPKVCGLSKTSGLHRWLESFWEPACRVRQWKQKMMSKDCQQSFGHCQMSCSFPKNIQDANKNQITLLLGKRMGLICFCFLLPCF